MNGDENLKLATQFLKRMEANDFDGALALATPNVRYWLSGPGEMDREQVRAFFAPVGKMIKSMRFTFVGHTVQGERVALEARNEATLTNGREYRNRYHFLFIVRDGKIEEVREYADSAPAQAAFFA